MRNFLCLGAGLVTMPLLHEITVHPELWNADTYRTTYRNTPHGEVDDIWLRYSRPESVADTEKLEAAQNDTTPQWYPAFQILPQARPLILAVMGAAGGYELGRALITRLPKGCRILPHADIDGDYVNRLDCQRYHVVLSGKPGSLFHCGDETVCMETGQVWWFDARSLHSVVNNSDDDRIHLILDVTLFPS